ncbi:MAG: glutamate racemase, partial [Pseudolabrys sp.]
MTNPTAENRARPSILLFDSGLGGLTVFHAVAAARPD